MVDNWTASAWRKMMSSSTPSFKRDEVKVTSPPWAINTISPAPYLALILKAPLNASSPAANPEPAESVIPAASIH